VLGDRRKDIVLASKFGMVMDDAEKLKGARGATSCGPSRTLSGA
jgi:hypothetical protein